MKYVIIGAGIAGTTAAGTIKDREPESEVVLISAEHFLPYKRYRLTEYLCDRIDEKNLDEITVENLRDRDIIFRKGQYVKTIDPEGKQIRLHHNEVMEYDKLLIAAGGTPTLGPILLPHFRHIQRYYSRQDILMVKQRLPEIRSCIVAGEGLSTLDLICGMCNLGKDVTYIVKGEKADIPLVSMEEAGLSIPLHDFLESRGVKIVVRDRITAVKRENNQYKVFTLNRRELTADIVFASDYYQPNISFIQETGIEKKLGILVDQHLRTSEKNIYAAGDCVEIYHPGIKNYWINFGWKNAGEQGAIAGKNMTGADESYSVKDTLIFNLMGKPLSARWWE